MQAAGRGVAMAVVVVGVLAATTTAHMLGFGSCRSFQGMAELDPVRFNGTWYVIRKIGTRSNCLTVNYNLMDDGQSFRVEETRRPPYSDGLFSIDLAVTNAGMLNRLDAASKYTVTWYTGIIPMSGTYTLVDTDYDTFALDYECQEFGFLRRVSATILSRKPELEAEQNNLLVDRLGSEFDVPRDRLNQVDQANCIALDANDYRFVVDEEGVKMAQNDYMQMERLSKLPKEEAIKELA